MRKQATAAEKRWMGRVALLGCTCCSLRGHFEPTTVHHITKSGRRLGHMFTIPLCPWHHQGYCKSGRTSPEMRAIFGPSLAESKSDFEAEFGTELELLERVKKCLG